MKFYAGLAAVVLGLTAGEVDAQRYCYKANGERYLSYASSCPQATKHEPTTIRACTLPDGSKAFGDRCPVNGIKTEHLDETELSNRSSGAESKTNSERYLRYSQQQEMINLQERRQADYEAEAERQKARYAAQQKQYEEQQQQQQQPPRHIRR